MSWTDEYRAKVREFIEGKGRKVQVEEKRFEWERDDEANVYGWVDYEAQDHIREGCRWIVPEGAVMYERTYSQFQDTFTENSEDHGVNVRGARCACGKYTDVILRWDGSVTDMLHTILGLPTSTNVEVEL